MMLLNENCDENNDDEHNMCAQIITDIATNCRDLKQISLPPNAGNYIEEAFHDVQIVSLQELNAFDYSQLRRLYPKMKKLQIGPILHVDQSLFNPDKIEYPELTRFAFSLTSSAYSLAPSHEDIAIIEEDVLKILDGNQQIHTLEVGHWPTIDFLEAISKMENIKTLILTTNVNVREQDLVHFDHVIQLIIINNDYLGGDFIRLPLVFNGLISFTYKYTGIKTIDNNWLKMIPKEKRQRLTHISMPNVHLSSRDLQLYSNSFQLQYIEFAHNGLLHDQQFIPFLEKTRIPTIKLFNVDEKRAVYLWKLNKQPLNRFKMIIVKTNESRKRYTVTMIQKPTPQIPNNQRPAKREIVKKN